jgi:hypothetical protein
VICVTSADRYFFYRSGTASKLKKAPARPLPGLS